MTKIVKNYYGLDYVTARFPVQEHPKHGHLISAEDVKDVDMKVARAIMQFQMPLRGLEVRFLRKCVGLSMQDFGTALGLSATAIMKWEKKEKIRLDPINEVGVRALVAQLLKVSIPGRWTDLRGVDKPKKIEVRPDAA